MSHYVFGIFCGVAEPDKHTTPAGVEESVVGKGNKQVTPTGVGKTIT